MDGDKNKTNPKNESVLDTSSPLYVHPSDYPKQLHVNDSLTDSNYADWSQEMLNFLFAKNKVGLIDGTLKKPDKTAPDYMAWMRADAMVKGWLTTAMEKDIRASVKYANTSLEIWNDLIERFGKESAPRAYELKQALTTVKQDGASVSSYYTRLRGMWDDIHTVQPTPRCSCDGCTCEMGKKLGEHLDKEKLYQFLMGLDIEFSVIKTQILALKPTPNLGSAYHLVAEDERQRLISAERRSGPETIALKAYAPNRHDTNRRDKNVFRELKHKEAVEPCSICKKEGHNENGCFKKIGYPDWWPGNKGKREDSKLKASCVLANSSPIPGLTNNQYKALLDHFDDDGSGPKNDTFHMANMAEAKNEELDWCG